MLYKKHISTLLTELAIFSDSQTLEMGIFAAIDRLAMALVSKSGVALNQIFYTYINFALNKIVSNFSELTKNNSFHDYEKLLRYVHNKKELDTLSYVKRSLLSRTLLQWDYSLPEICTTDSVIDVQKKMLKITALLEHLLKTNEQIENKKIIEAMCRQFIKTLGGIILNKVLHDLDGCNYYQQLEYLDTLIAIVDSFPRKDIPTKIHNEVFSFILNKIDTQKNPFGGAEIHVHVDALLVLTKQTFLSTAETSILANKIVFMYEHFGNALELNTPRLFSLNEEIELVEKKLTFSFQVTNILRKIHTTLGNYKALILKVS